MSNFYSLQNRGREREKQLMEVAQKRRRNDFETGYKILSTFSVSLLLASVI